MVHVLFYITGIVVWFALLTSGIFLLIEKIAKRFYNNPVKKKTDNEKMIFIDKIILKSNVTTDEYFKAKKYIYQLTKNNKGS